MSVTWNGPTVIKSINKVSKDAVMSAVFLVEEWVINDVNVDTGRHRASITGAVSFQGPDRQETEAKVYISSKTGRKQSSTAKDGVERPKARPGELVGTIGSNVEYAIYRELEKKSLRQGLEVKANEIKQLFNAGL